MHARERAAVLLARIHDATAELMVLAAQEQATRGGPLARSLRNLRRIQGAVDAMGERLEAMRGGR